MVRNLLRTRYGRCLSAVRDNDRAADAMGMHPGLTKVYAFGLAGFFAGMAGALHAYVYRGVGFESFTLHHSITYLAMAIVGGLGTLTDLSGGRRPSSRSNCRWKPLPNTPVRYCRRTGILPPL
jgi:branched-chain amino acid transport system permease protein